LQFPCSIRRLVEIFKTCAQVLARAMGEWSSNAWWGAYLLGRWASGLAGAVGGRVAYRVTEAIAIRTGVNYLRTSYRDPSPTLRGQSNIKSTASIVYSFVRRLGSRRLA
jgi:hypothetical protein